ncbi:MAG: hypothetical protein ACLS3U_05945 [Lachnospiraceae bacterium]
MAMAMAMAATMMPIVHCWEEKPTILVEPRFIIWKQINDLGRMQRVTRLSIWMQQHRLRKYNIKFVYAKPDGYDGYNLGELIQAGITAGDTGVDILDSERMH